MFRRHPAAYLLAPGDQLGFYRLVRKLGTGAMGVVYEASHTGIGRQVALKVLHSYLCNDEEMVARLLREARSSNLVQHPGVVQIMDHHRQRDGTTYLVMEFLDGETLRVRLRRGPPLSSSEIVSIGGQLAAALAAAHAKGVIHRDLKPENVMLVSDGQRVKILDFGLARAASFDSHLTLDGRRLGTPAYMAPEQCAGERAMEPADVYALGALLYELCAGRPPFLSEDQGALYGMHRFEEPSHLSKFAPQANEALVQLIHEMLAKVPTARPTMLEVCQTIQSMGAPIEVWEVGGPSMDEPRSSLPVDKFSTVSDALHSRPASSVLNLNAPWWRRLFWAAGAGVIGGAVWFAWRDGTLAHRVHYRMVSRAMQGSVEAPLGRHLDTGYYCAFFQHFQGGKILYTTSSVSGLPSSHYGRTFFVLSNELPVRWAMLQQTNYQSVRDRGIFLQSVAKGRTDALDLGLPRPFTPLSDIATYFRPFDQFARPAVAGSIARLYALQALDTVLGEPLNHECPTTVLIQTYEKGIVIGGAPNDSCTETHSIYRLYPDSRLANRMQGHWDRADRQLLLGSIFHQSCIRP